MEEMDTLAWILTPVPPHRDRPDRSPVEPRGVVRNKPIFTETSLPYLIDMSCCNFAESILHVAKTSSCTTVPHLMRW